MRNRREIENSLSEKEKVAYAKFAHTTEHGGVKKKTQEATNNFYNLDVIISVDYRVKS